ncbi:hypothetical protein BIW11_02591 [Tropilaelaps mercedesae]|uniref:Uncharacterized protein n=1 Tax=Tropilaelaps mercedesae TaxID=418985 RepID=A0A1V9Y0G0_9ACAR|nr:hypothetical protein BIW11_02591 [Tropilaelaps mercedesae]
MSTYDEYEHLNDEADRFVNGGHSGKQRSKKEAFEHQNRPDPSGHTRKIGQYEDLVLMIITIMTERDNRECKKDEIVFYWR